MRMSLPEIIFAVLGLIGTYAIGLVSTRDAWMPLLKKSSF